MAKKVELLSPTLEAKLFNRMSMERRIKNITKETTQPEDKAQKKERLLKRAQAEAKGMTWDSTSKIIGLVTSNSEEAEIEIGRDSNHYGYSGEAHRGEI